MPAVPITLSNIYQLSTLYTRHSLQDIISNIVPYVYKSIHYTSFIIIRWAAAAQYIIKYFTLCAVIMIKMLKILFLQTNVLKILLFNENDVCFVIISNGVLSTLINPIMIVSSNITSKTILVQHKCNVATYFMMIVIKIRLINAR